VRRSCSTKREKRVCGEGKGSALPLEGERVTFPQRILDTVGWRKSRCFQFGKALCFSICEMEKRNSEVSVPRFDRPE